MSFWDECMTPHPLKDKDVAHPTMDGDDVVCSNCGYIIGYGDSETDRVCPSCGAKFEWE